VIHQPHTLNCHTACDLIENQTHLRLIEFRFSASFRILPKISYFSSLLVRIESLFVVNFWVFARFLRIYDLAAFQDEGSGQAAGS
jgi:hypothetical protein